MIVVRYFRFDSFCSIISRRKGNGRLRTLQLLDVCTTKPFFLTNDCFFSEKSDKQQKRDAKKAEKAAKKAVHKSEAGQVSNAEAGSGDNEPDHSAGKYGVREMIQSRDKPAIKLLNVEALSAKLKDQDVWVRGRLHTSRAKGTVVI